VTGDWDVQLVQDIFWPWDAEEILRIPIDVDMDDWPAWHFDAKGIFSVKSAYKIAVARREALAGRDASTSDGNGFQWYKIWKLKVPNKVQMFLWRFAHNSPPVRRNIAHRGIKLDTLCPVCKKFDEDCGIVLKA